MITNGQVSGSLAPERGSRERAASKGTLMGVEGFALEGTSKGPEGGGRGYGRGPWPSYPWHWARKIISFVLSKVSMHEGVK
jgi:hypothetical protein